MKHAFISLSILLALVFSCEAKLTVDQRRQLPAAVTDKVEFARDIQPIFESSCVTCHGRGKEKGGFRLDTRETFLKGGDSGPAAVAGQSAESYLIELVSGLDPDNVMPVKGSKLTAKQVGLLRGWIDQGMSWDAGITFGKLPTVNLHPRRPELPPVMGEISHPIDRLLAPYFQQHGIVLADSVEGRTFARRASLDAIGLLPTPRELEEFLRDKRPDKRERWVARLLLGNQGYAAHWISFWNDLLRNDDQGAGNVDGLRVPITEWLYAALATNQAYDHFVAELVNPQSKGTAGFVNGIRWRGDLNASQKPHMQAAQGVAQVFLGVNLKCASCHDSLINDWSLSDAYGMAAVYAEEPRLEMHECDRPTGRKVAARFLFPELGDIPGDATDNERIRRLAEIITSRANGRLTRTVVNRLWQRLMGRGLVDPVDEMEQMAWHPDLLDWLAEDFAEHGHDLKRTLGLILTSRAYQMPSVSLGDRQKAPFIFTGPAVRRLTAEQFRDALGSLTGVWYESAARPIDFTAGLAPGVRADLLLKGPRWIWSVPGADAGAEVGTVCFYKMFHLPTAPAEALVAVTADSRFVLYVNGVRAASGKQWSKVQVADIRAYLHAGENVMTVEAVNAFDSNSTSHGVSKPAGLVLCARFRDRGRPMDVVTDSSWRWATNRTLVMNAEGAKPKGLKPSVELGDATMLPWSIEPALVAGLSQALVRGGVRSALVAADPLATALGRPPREQVVSVRASEGTTLQALELTNGRTLTDVIRRGAERLLAGAGSSQREFVASLYLKAFGRAPTEGESRLVGELLSQPMKVEHVEDFIWSMTMLPEFQLIY